MEQTGGWIELLRTFLDLKTDRGNIWNLSFLTKAERENAEKILLSPGLIKNQTVAIFFIVIERLSDHKL